MTARRLWLLLVPLGLVGLVLVAERKPGASDRALPAAAPGGDRAPVVAPGAEDATRHEVPSATPLPSGDATGERVRVRSSLGLPLEHVELQQPDGTWRSLLLDEGGLSVPADRRPARVRARGHRPSDVQQGTRELVLEPHTSLVLTSFPWSHLRLADLFPSWPNLREQGETFLSSGACDQTTWAIAFDASQLRAVVPSLEMVFHLDDGTEAHVTHALESGRHDVYAWPRPPLDAPARMLTVDVERGGPVRGALAAEVHAYPDSLKRPPGSMALFNKKADWGRFVLLDYLELFTGRFEEAPFEIGPLVVGKRYAVTVRDEASGDHERLSFVHDGAPVHLALSGGLRLRGRIDVSPELPVARLDRIVWSFGDGPASSYWHDEPSGVPVAQDGTFELALPGIVPFSDRAPFPRPDGLELQLWAGGFGMQLLRLDTSGQTEIDLGTVRLKPLASQISLASDHGLAPQDLAYSSEALVRDAATNATLSYGVDGARPSQDGTLAVALTPMVSGGFQVSGVAEDSRPWPHPEALVMLVNGDGFAFRLGPDQLYHREPESTFHLRLEAALAPGARELALRWEWEGILVWIRNWPAQAFEAAQEWTFTAPSKDARLRWCTGKEAPDAHPPVPLSDGEIELRVP